MTSNSYDKVPYLANPLPQTHPSRLAAIAAMFGLSYVKPAKSRVLEIGCASGVNLLGMAHFMPESEFVGVDLSKVQINEAKQRAKALKADNVTYHQMDLADIDAKFGEFYYIIAHGVFSWISNELQQMLLSICNENLSQDGIAFVSYNVLPGWRMKQATRDVLLALTPPDMSAQRRLQFGVSWIKEALELTSKEEKRPLLHQSLSNELNEIMVKKDVRYLAHEYLETHNEPLLFREFLTKTRDAGLAYLGDAEPASMVRHITNPTLREFFKKHTSSSMTDQEQAVDIITGRTFRQSLLVKGIRHSKVNRALTSAFFKQLHIHTRILKSKDAEGNDRYTHHRLKDLNAQPPHGTATLDVLSAKAGVPTHFSELAEKFLELSPQGNENIFSDILFSLLGAGVIDIFADPHLPQLAPGATPIALLDLDSKRNNTTNAIGENLALDPMQRLLLPHLIGEWDKEALIDKMEELLAQGVFNINPVPPDKEQLRMVLSQSIDKAVAGLKLCGIMG